MDGVCIVNGRAGVDVAVTIEAEVVGTEVAGKFSAVVAVTIDKYVAGTMSAEVAGVIDTGVPETLNVEMGAPAELVAPRWEVVGRSDNGASS